MVTLRVNYRFGGYGRPVGQVLTSSNFIISSKLGRQKCRPFFGADCDMGVRDNLP